MLSLTDNRESGANPELSCTREAIKRESGESPERSGHCKRKRGLQKPLHVKLCEKA